MNLHTPLERKKNDNAPSKSVASARGYAIKENYVSDTVNPSAISTDSKEKKDEMYKPITTMAPLCSSFEVYLR